MKFCGKVGFWLGDKEVKPGVYKPDILERPYVGDVLRLSRRFQSADKQNDDLVPNNQISILSDIYMQQNWSSIKYVVWNNAKLKVTSVDINYPRITLEIGGLYNEKDDKRNEKSFRSAQDLMQYTQI